MPQSHYDVIVVGAGAGGAPCAALLAGKGMKTLLLEKNSRAGGKAMTVSKKGFRHELWPVTGGPMFNSQFDVLLEELGLESEKTHPETIHTLHYRQKSGAYQALDLPHTQEGEAQELDPSSFLEMMGWLELGLEDLDPIVGYITEMRALTPEQISEMDDITFHEYISRFNVPAAFYAYIAAQLNVIFVQTIDQIAASEVIKTMQAMMGGGTGYYSKGGYGRLFERCVASLEQDGGEVRYKAKVNRIIVEDGQTRGVATDEGDIHAPIVISNAGIQPTVLKLVGEEHFDEDYSGYVKGLVPSLALMGVRYFIDKPLLTSCSHIVFSDDSFVNKERAKKASTGAVPDELMVFLTVPSNFDAELAPPGKQCVLTSTVCPPDPKMENLEAWWDKMDEMMARVWPEFHSHVETRECYGPMQVSALTRDQVLPGIGGECIGLGQVAGQCGKHKPSAKAPIEGLFYVGCDAGGFGCGTHQAVDSALNVSKMVHEYSRGK